MVKPKQIGRGKYMDKKYVFSLIRDRDDIVLYETHNPGAFVKYLRARGFPVS